MLRRISTYLRGLPKWRLFGLLVVTAGILAAGASFLTYFTVLEGRRAAPVTIALIAPMSGPDAAIGQSMRSGVERWLVETHGHRGLPGGHFIDLKVIDEAVEANPADKIVNDSKIIGVIGPFGRQAALRARPLLETAGIPAISLVSVDGDKALPNTTMFDLSSRPESEIRFLANYVRNVLGERLVSIILPADAENQALDKIFDEVLQRFGTKVVYRWAIPTDSDNARDAGLKSAAVDIYERKIAGTILVLGSQAFAANAVASLRGADVINRIVGTRTLATNAFRKAIETEWKGRTPVDAVLNGTVVTVPVLFDTAGISAQSFRDNVVAATGESPDWPAVLAYDASTVFGVGLTALKGIAGQDPLILRGKLRAQIASINAPERAIQGLSGPIFFDPLAGGSLPELVGIFDGRELVSALTQLSPIRDQGVYNYLEELAAGRALYVNDRFMYKTNVVYTGVQLEKVFELNTDTNIADIEFIVWFRWRGTLDPQNVVSPNALAQIQLTTPEREGKSGDLNYRSYRVRGKFYMNSSDEPHRFGTQIVEVKFRHRILSRNNLMYVTDVLGMGLNLTSKTSAEDDDFLHRLFGTHNTQSVLTRQLTTGRVLAGVSGWLVERAWLSQELGQASSGGDPVYVGFGKPAPVFSTIGLGMVVKPDAFEAGSLVPGNWFIYIAIFALAMSLLAYLLDRRDRGHFWRIQTLLLRIIAWPVLLAAVSNLALDYAQDNLTPSSVATLSNISGMLWWLVPARLLLISVQRFVWVPLEVTTGRKVPTVFIMIVDVVIFILAGFGIVAFVLGKTITSLLAGSGVLAMIVGLALQSNLKDIFSGIMLNLERPFVLNDMLRMGNRIGRVVDVSWRSTRLETDTGTIVSMPNSRVSEAEIENLSRARLYEISTTLALDPSYPPEEVKAALHAVAESFDFPVTVTRKTGLSKIDKIADAFVAHYVFEISVLDYKNSRIAAAQMMQKIWEKFRDANIGWDLPEGHLNAAISTVEA